MELVKIPDELLPVLRRWREDRNGLSYLAGSHIILLQEDLPLAETLFVLHHEATHSQLFNCALGFLLTTLQGFEFQLARIGLQKTQSQGEALLQPGWKPLQGFFSRRPRRAQEFGSFPSNLEGHLRALSQEESFQQLLRAYLEIRRRKAVLLDEWRFPHEGLATLVQLSAVRAYERVQRDSQPWAEVLGLPPDAFDIADAREQIATFMRILMPGEHPVPTAAQLVGGRWRQLDPYVDGASFLYHHLLGNPGAPSPFPMVQLASQIPYGMLPGLDAPFDQFLAVARDACSPTVRLGRLVQAMYVEVLKGKSPQECLPSAIREEDRAAAAATQGYYAWEWSALHASRRMNPFLGLADQPAQLPYGLTQDQSLYHRDPQFYANRGWVIYNSDAVLCEARPDFSLAPTTHTDQDVSTLMSMLQMHFQAQSFERLVENLVSWNCVSWEDGTQAEWV